MGRARRWCRPGTALGTQGEGQVRRSMCQPAGRLCARLPNSRPTACRSRRRHKAAMRPRPTNRKRAKRRESQRRGMREERDRPAEWWTRAARGPGSTSEKRCDYSRTTHGLLTDYSHQDTQNDSQKVLHPSSCLRETNDAPHLQIGDRDKRVALPVLARKTRAPTWAIVRTFNHADIIGAGLRDELLHGPSFSASRTRIWLRRSDPPVD